VHGGELERVLHDLAKFRLVVGKAAAGAAQCKGRAQHDRVADFGRRGQPLVHALGDPALQHRLAQRQAQLLELLAVLGLFDAGKAGAEDLHLALVEHALAGQLHGEVEPRLPAEAGDDGVRALVADDLGDVFQIERLHVDLVGDGGVGHDRGRVGVDEHDLVPLPAQGLAGLGAGVVELAGLADDDGARADDEDLLDVVTSGH